MFSLCLCVLVLAACGDRNPGGTPAPAAEFSATDQNLPKIVAFGNSLTAGLGLPESESYPAVLQKMLQADGYKYEVVNAGVSGDTTSGGLRRIDWSLEGNVKFVIVELGANDILRGQPMDLMKKNLGEIIQRARQRGAIVLLAGMEAPTNSGPEYRNEVHQAFQALAKEHGVALIPFFLKDVVGAEKLIQADGSHPNAEGAKVLAQTVYDALKPLL